MAAKVVKEGIEALGRWADNNWDLGYNLAEEMATPPRPPAMQHIDLPASPETNMVPETRRNTYPYLTREDTVNSNVPTQLEEIDLELAQRYRNPSNYQTEGAKLDTARMEGFRDEMQSIVKNTNNEVHTYTSYDALENKYGPSLGGPRAIKSGGVHQSLVNPEQRAKYGDQSEHITAIHPDRIQWTKRLC